MSFEIFIEKSCFDQKAKWRSDEESVFRCHLTMFFICILNFGYVYGSSECFRSTSNVIEHYDWIESLSLNGVDTLREKICPNGIRFVWYECTLRSQAFETRIFEYWWHRHAKLCDISPTLFHILGSVQCTLTAITFDQGAEIALRTTTKK